MSISSKQKEESYLNNKYKNNLNNLLERANYFVVADSDKLLPKKEEVPSDIDIINKIQDEKKYKGLCELIRTNNYEKLKDIREEVKKHIGPYAKNNSLSNLDDSIKSAELNISLNYLKKNESFKNKIIQEIFSNAEGTIFLGEKSVEALSIFKNIKFKIKTSQIGEEIEKYSLESPLKNLHIEYIATKSLDLSNEKSKQNKVSVKSLKTISSKYILKKKYKISSDEKYIGSEMDENNKNFIIQKDSEVSEDKEITIKSNHYLGILTTNNLSIPKKYPNDIKNVLVLTSFKQDHLISLLKSCAKKDIKEVYLVNYYDDTKNVTDKIINQFPSLKIYLVDKEELEPRQTTLIDVELLNIN